MKRRRTTRNSSRLTVPERHQLKIARDTLRMSPAMAKVMGGMTIAEAREVFKTLMAKARGTKNARRNAGYWSERIPAGRGHGIVIWSNDPDVGPFHVQPWVNDWDTPGREVGKYKTLGTARKKARAYMQKMGWISNPRVPFRVVFKREGKIHTWERYADTAAKATSSAREALRHEFPDGDYSLISVKPVAANPPFRPGTVMSRFRRGTLRSSSGRKVTRKPMAKAILLSELRAQGRIPPRQNAQKYEVTRKFIGGTLKGLTHTEVTPVKFRIGQVVRKPIGGSPYKIVSVKPVSSRNSHRRNELDPRWKKTLAARQHSHERFIKRALEIHHPGKKFGDLTAFEQSAVLQFAHKLQREDAAGLKNPRRNSVAWGRMRKKPSKRIRAALRKITRKRKLNYENAEELYERFHGRKAGRVSDTGLPVADYGSHDELGQLGKLVSLTIGDKEADKPWCKQITWGGSEAPDLAAEPGGSQLYLVGGNQNIDRSLDKLPIDTTKDMLDLGFAYQIEYFTRKAFDNHQPVTYYHDLGEETGESPRVVYDRVKRRIHLVGGAYKVKPEGVVN